MPLQKIKRKLRNSDFSRFSFINVFIALACILTGYLIAVISDSTQETYQEFKEIESVVREVGGTGSIEELKEKVKNNPQLLEKVKPSMIDKLQSNPLIKRQIEEKMKEFE